MFEKSKWISLKTKDRDISVLFRKEFCVDKNLKSAELNICMLGLGICTVNGKNVTDEVLTTPITRYDYRVYYNSYDVTELIEEGRNVIGIHCGNGLYVDNQKTWQMDSASWKGVPKALAELKITYTDGTEILINTDSLWKTSPGGCVYNHMRQGEIYDFNLTQKGFDKKGFDDSAWMDVELHRNLEG